MTKSSDYPQGDESKAYCKHCAREDGSMQSYDEKLAGMSAFLVRTQDLDEAAARAVAERNMRGLPAWQSH